MPYKYPSRELGGTLGGKTPPWGGPYGVHEEFSADATCSMLVPQFPHQCKEGALEPMGKHGGDQQDTQLQEGGGPDSVLTTPIRPPLLPSHLLGQESSPKYSLWPHNHNHSIPKFRGPLSLPWGRANTPSLGLSIPWGGHGAGLELSTSSHGG